VAWARFDNSTGATQPLGEVTVAPGATIEPPFALPATAGAYVEVTVSAIADAHPSWSVPIHAFFRRTADGWTLVGLQRAVS
jgi:hypothetical protein